MPSSSSSLQPSSKLALKGSSKIVCDYFEFALNSILYQRGIYPQEDFITIKKYDLPMVINDDYEVQKYINNIMKQIKKWIYGSKLTKFVVVIISKSNLETVERWEFNIETKEPPIENGDDDDDNNNNNNNNEGKSRQEIQKEIRAIIRQITSSVSYLPVLKDSDTDTDGEGYTFNVLVYTDPNTSIPIEWCDTQGDGKILHGNNIDNVKFTSFSTDIHQIGTSVSYKYE
ncbi:mitotic spindle checkpoint component (MAD2), putative [Candida dubliniensis CD36]|uniref:Mitotic spindle checkpoint component (MAD2), putative n=1 Tax=Candida dubliniensis (strain CD36 / ATCC MYA-646 / CBS 7987 / NCPF 3949 / NRRL Y-17841) TaxID=573826 RepID=B9W7I3_CANDC|nr:mitotic spindle checkpoint component (MAD2), putative [Candida dubliniensis CD36]CAX44643.1 mitotic spindle checkpoint component (MAD2), putative [Candida dubliniensis CD36]